jgi:AcrR family transcriptional regulator
MELFAKEGSRGTPLAAIAERIGVTTPAITHHFGTKQGLLLEIVEKLDQADVEYVGTTERSGIEQLNQTRQWAARLEENDAFANLSRLRMVIAAEALDPNFAAHAHFVERQRRNRRTAAAILKAGQRDGTIRRDVDVRATATEIVAVFHGAQFQWFLDRDDVDLVRVINRYIDRLMRELSPPQ